MVLGDDGFHIFGSSIPVTPGKVSVPGISITEQQRESINTASIHPHQGGRTQYSNGNSNFFNLYIGNSSQPHQGGGTQYSNGNSELFDFNIGKSSQSYQEGPGQSHQYSNGNSSHSYQGLGQRHQYPNGNTRYCDFNIDSSYTRSILGNLLEDGYSSVLSRSDVTSVSSNSVTTSHINGFPFMIPPYTDNTNYQQQQHAFLIPDFVAEQNRVNAGSIGGGGRQQGIQLCFGETGTNVPYVGFSLQQQRAMINFKNPPNTNHLGPMTPEQFRISQTRKNLQVERENYTDPKIKETNGISIHKSNSQTLDFPAELGHQTNIQPTIEESQNKEDDLNTTTPVQKPRRKKHRPKVIREGKKLRNPKNVDQTPEGKRTSRKKKEEHSSERPSNGTEESPIKRQRTVRTQVRRTLSFDNKEFQLNDNESRSSTLARSNCNKYFLPEENSFKKSENSEVHNVDVKISQTLRRHNIRENLKVLARERGKEHHYHKDSDVLDKINEHNCNGITTHRDIDHVQNSAKKLRTNKSVSAGNGLNGICEVMIMQQNIVGTNFNHFPLDSKHPCFGYQTQEGFQSLVESLNSADFKVPRKRRTRKKNTSSYKTGGPMIPNIDLIDLIIQKLQNMNINASFEGILHQELQKENAMVVYNRSSEIVPFQENLFTPRKKLARAKVDLDSETNRVWMVLMGKNNGDCPEGADFDKKKWWEGERRVFQGRANSFIARMHLVQGDRRFSRWKGSVVDSVVGVFLTQNVSDHLSSSAFMSLVAKFPNCTRVEHAKPKSTAEYVVSFTEDDEISVKEGCDQSKTLEDRLNQNHHCINPNKELTSTHEGSTIIHEEGLTIIHEEGSTTIHEEEKRVNMLSYTECTLKLSETANCHDADDMRSIESTLSSQHSSESPVQALDQIGSGSALFVEEDIINGNSFDSMHMKTSFTELLQMAKDKVLQDYCPPKIGKIITQNEPQHDFEGVISSAPSDSSTPLQDDFYWHNHSHYRNRIESEIRIDSVQSVSEHFLQKKDDVIVCEPHSNPINHHNNSEFTGSLGLKEEHKGSMPQKTVEFNLKDQKVHADGIKEGNKAKAKTVKKTSENIDWDRLRRETSCNGVKKERNPDNIDSIDWEAIRRAPVGEIANIIRDRGMNNMLAARIKDFLDRLVRDHGSVDLEWLRDAPPDKVKDYLLSFRGLGLKSVECVRLLSLEHLAFPVDTNVGRICVRLGWVPLQPLPESLQLHLLEMYPMLETIQKYLWPRLCTLDQRTLYELHYQLITFGKVFCTKTKPNCNACPMRGECKHFASAFASARLSLPGPEEKGLVASTNPISSDHGHKPFTPQETPLQLEGTQEPPLQIEVVQAPPLQIEVTQALPINLEGTSILKEPDTCQPIIEEVLTPEPEPEPVDIPEWAIEDGFYEDPDEIPTIDLNIEQLTQNVQNILQENEALLQNGDMSNALVALTPEAASIPQPKLKNVSRLRTEHLVYELPDGHPLLNSLDRREPDDPSPYLLAIWTPGETAQSTELPEAFCKASSNGGICDKSNCFSCNSIREAQSQKVRGTLLIPCRTAMRGSFPLNGTYFQVNEVFADHASSIVPMDVPRRWIWSLTRRTVYFGTSVTSIFRGLTTEGIQQCFWRGFVCVRGFDQKTRAPRPLLARLHFSENRLVRNNKKKADNLKEQKKIS